MLDPFSNPQTKLQQQTQQQVSQGQQRELAPTVPGKPNPTIPHEDPTSAQLSTTHMTQQGMTAAKQQEATDKQGFKAALGRAKEGLIDQASTKLGGKLEAGVKQGPKVSQGTRDLPNQTLKRTPTAQPPIAGPPVASRLKPGKPPAPSLPRM